MADLTAPNNDIPVSLLASPDPDRGAPETTNTAHGYQDDAPFHTDYEVTNHYFKDRHIYMGGVTSPSGFQGQSAAFVQLAAPTLVWVCEWTACRADGHPDIPDPDPVNTNWILLDEQFDPFMIGVLDDGDTPIQRISGRYVYGHVNPSASTSDDVDYPCPPWLDPDQFDLDIPDDALVNDISSPQGGGAAQIPPGVPVLPNDIGFITR